LALGAIYVMEISEMVRRFIMCFFEVGGHVIIISPARHLLFKRATYFPYTYGETPWQTLYDLARFSLRVDVVTTWPKDEKELQLLYNIAENVKPPRAVPLHLYLNEDIPVLLVNEKETFDGVRLIRTPKEVEELRKVAEDIISRSKEVGIFEYDDIQLEYCRRFRYSDARCS
jgi:Xaa-Pro aminopeptidase